MKAGTIVLLGALILGLIISVSMLDDYERRTALGKANRALMKSRGTHKTWMENHPLPTNWAKYSAFTFGGLIVLTIIGVVVAHEARPKDKASKIEKLSRELEALKKEED